MNRFCVARRYERAAYKNVCLYCRSQSLLWMGMLQVPFGTDSICNVTDDTGTSTGTGKQPTERYACADSRVRESKQKSVTYVNRVNYLT